MSHETGNEFGGPASGLVSVAEVKAVRLRETLEERFCVMSQVTVQSLTKGSRGLEARLLVLAHNLISD